MKRNRKMAFFGALILIAVAVWFWPRIGVHSRRAFPKPPMPERWAENTTAVPSEVGIQRNERPDLSANRIRSMLAIAPNEIGMIRIPARFLSQIPGGEENQVPSDPFHVVTRKVAGDQLEAAFRNGEVPDASVKDIGESVNWSGANLTVTGETTYLLDGAGCRIHFRIEDTSKGAAMELMARFPNDSVGIIKLPDSSGDGLLIVPHGD